VFIPFFLCLYLQKGFFYCYKIYKYVNRTIFFSTSTLYKSNWWFIFWNWRNWKYAFFFILHENPDWWHCESRNYTVITQKSEITRNFPWRGNLCNSRIFGQLLILKCYASNFNKKYYYYTIYSAGHLVPQLTAPLRQFQGKISNQKCNKNGAITCFHRAERTVDHSINGKISNNNMLIKIRFKQALHVCSVHAIKRPWSIK